jgi:hypothetical protein
MTHLNEIFLSEGKLELDSDEKYIWKTVLRTGEWKVTPRGGTANKPLVVVRDGVSDTANNVISLSEILNAFDDGAFEHVTVPLAQNIAEGDHADIAKNNTGFIRKLKIVDEDGVSKLKAAFDFTEPDIKARVERGTIPNTSVGILYDFVRKSDAKKFPVALAHVALTHRPWIDQMEPFGVAASDDSVTEVASFEPSAGEEETLEWEEGKSFKTILSKLENAIHGDNFNLDENFKVTDVQPGLVKIANTIAGIEWTTAFTIDDGVAKLPPFLEWGNQQYTKPTLFDQEAEEAKGEPEVTEIEAPAAQSLDPNDLQDASLLREERFAQKNNNHKGVNMSIEQINGLNLSELSDEARAAVEALVNKNTELESTNRDLSRTSREATAEKRVQELGELGLSEWPGFLKTVRQILLSDDGATAALLLSDDGKTEEKVTATEIVEKLVAAMPKSEEGKLELSGQASLGNGDHTKPDEDNVIPFEDRLKEARQALGKPVENAN